MLSPQKLRNVTQQTLEDQEINRLVSLTQDFQNLLEQLPGLANQPLVMVSMNVLFILICSS